MSLENWMVLVIEDEVDSAEVVSRVLKYHKIPYRVADSAEVALSMIAEHRPTIVIVDLALPGMDGWELLRTIRSSPPIASIPAVAVTAYHSIHTAQQAIEAGFSAYLPKPIEPATFVAELERVMEGVGK